MSKLLTVKHTDAAGEFLKRAAKHQERLQKKAGLQSIIVQKRIRETVKENKSTVAAMLQDAVNNPLVHDRREGWMGPKEEVGDYPGSVDVYTTPVKQTLWEKLSRFFVSIWR